MKFTYNKTTNSFVSDLREIFLGVDDRSCVIWVLNSENKTASYHFADKSDNSIKDVFLRNPEVKSTVSYIKNVNIPVGLTLHVSTTSAVQNVQQRCGLYDNTVNSDENTVAGAYIQLITSPNDSTIVINEHPNFFLKSINKSGNINVQRFILNQFSLKPKPPV